MEGAQSGSGKSKEREEERDPSPPLLRRPLSLESHLGASSSLRWAATATEQLPSPVSIVVVGFVNGAQREAEKTKKGKPEKGGEGEECGSAHAEVEAHQSTDNEEHRQAVSRNPLHHRRSLGHLLLLRFKVGRHADLL